MARVTVEDCVEQVPNRFELVMKAAHRARNLAGGAPITVDRDNDKNPVVALREIADQTVDLDNLETGLITNMQRYVAPEERAAIADADSSADLLRSSAFRDRMVGDSLPHMIFEDVDVKED